MKSDAIGRGGSSRLRWILLGGWLVLFAANFILHDSRGLGAGADSFGYLTPAVNLARGHGYAYLGKPELIYEPGLERPELVWPPGYGLRTLPLYLAGVELIRAAVITNVIFLALACLFTYLICRFYVSRLWALVAILFVVTNAYIVDYTALAMSEVTFMAIASGAGYFILRFIRQPSRNPLNLVAAGVFAGCATLTRPEGVGVTLALVGFLLLDLVLRQPAPRFQSGFAARLAFYALMFVASAAVVYSPYVVFLSENLGHFALTGKSEIVAIEGNVRVHSPRDQFAQDLYYQTAHAEGIRSTLGDGFRRLPTNLIRYARYGVEESEAPLAALGLVLVIGLWRNRFRRFPIEFRNDPDFLETLGFCVVMLSPLVPMAYFLSERRMFIPYNLYVIVGAVVLMDRIASAAPAAAPLPNQRAFALAVAAPLLLLGAYSNIAMSSTMWGEYPLQRAAIALAALTESRPVNVMALRRAEVASYYANDRRLLTDARLARAAPDLTTDRVAETMRTERLQYLLLDRTYIKTRPGVASLWTCAPNTCPQGLRLVAEDPDNYRIFKLVPVGEQSSSAPK